MFILDSCYDLALSYFLLEFLYAASNGAAKL